MNTAETSTPATSLAFLSDGGEMGHLTRNYDWKNSPLGPVQQWPQSLRTTLGILLHSAFPMFLFWGKDRICFYNDAYRPSLGDHGKHPAVGKRGEEVWGEIWNFIGPLIEKVMETGQAAWFEDQLLPIYRNGRLEEVYWTFSYSPVYNDEGRIDGVFVTCSETTQKVNSLRRLQASSQRFQHLVAEATMGTVVLLGEDLVVEVANDAYAQLIGRKSSDLVGKRIFDVVPEVEETFRRIIHNVMTTGSSRHLYEQPYTVNSPEGVISRYLNLVYKPYLDESNRIAGVIVLCQDVTEQVKAKRRIQESEERFEAAVQAVQGVVWTNNAEGEMVGEQPGWSALTGQTKEAYEGYGWASAVHPDDAAKSVDVWNEAVREGKTFVFTHRLRVRDGRYRFFSIRAVPLKNDDGSIREWVGVHTDITEHHLAEQILKESEERFRNLANNAPMFIWMVDQNAVITYANRQLLAFIGIASEADVRTAGGWEKVTHPDDLQLVFQAFTDGLKNRTDYEVEARLRNNAADDYEWFLFKASPRILANGDFAGFIGTAVSIHQQKMLLTQMEERVRTRTRELNLANDALLQSNNDLKQFAHVASHDLKEPVRKIQTFSHRLYDEFSEILVPRAKTYLQKIIRSAERMTSMIDGVLRYSSLNATEAEFELVDLNAVVENIVGDLEVLIARKSAALSRDPLPAIEGSEVLLYQLFYNLVNNSLKFSREETPPQIAITSRELGDEVEILVTDNGIGFDTQYAERIFESFTRLNAKDQFEGTGLGLSLCKKIVQRHGGTITAMSTAGEGATFAIRLPKRQKDESKD